MTVPQATSPFSDQRVVLVKGKGSGHHNEPTIHLVEDHYNLQRGTNRLLNRPRPKLRCCLNCAHRVNASLQQGSERAVKIK